MTAAESTEAIPSGIAGWLILPAIGIVVTPPFILYTVVHDLLPVFEQVGDFPLLRLLLVLEVAVNLGLIGFGVYTAIRFFGKRQNAPGLFIRFLAAQVIFLLADTVLAAALFGPAVVDSGAARDIVRGMIAAGIWIPYFRKSVRVRNTFVEP